MQARKIIRRHLGKALEGMHPKRALVLMDATLALLQGGRLSLSAWGRSLMRPAQVKHRIKCIDRLWGNVHLQRELPLLTQSHCQSLLQGQSHPLILIDWTELSETHCALSASVVSSGRSLPIYHKVCTASQMGNRRSHARFLQGLKACLPTTCVPILVSDAGFHNVWFQQVMDMGWDFVGRIGKGVTFQYGSAMAGASAAWHRVGTLFEKATRHARSLGVLQVAKSNPIWMQTVLYKAPSRRRRGSKRVTPRGVHPGSSSYKKYQRRGTEPWVLGTSLRNASAKKIVRYYQYRMQCEELFRDLKNHRYGFCLHDVRCKTIGRLNVLLFIAMLAVFIATLFGCIAEMRNIHLRFQANTQKHKRVLSRFVLGLFALREQRPAFCADNAIVKNALQHLLRL